MTPPAPPSGEPQVFTLALQAEGATLPELFEKIAQQLFHQLINPTEVGAVLREKIVVEGPNLQRLLQEWVTNLLNLLRIQKMIFGQFQIVNIKTPEEGPCTLLAEVVGELVDPQRHEFKLSPGALLVREVRLTKVAEVYHAEIIMGE